MSFWKNIFSRNKPKNIENSFATATIANGVKFFLIYVDNDPSPIIGLDNTIGVVLSLTKAGSINSQNVALVMDWEIKQNTPDNDVLSKAKKHFEEMGWHYAPERIKVIPFFSEKLQMEGKAILQSV